MFVRGLDDGTGLAPIVTIYVICCVCDVVQDTMSARPRNQMYLLIVIVLRDPGGAHPRKRCMERPGNPVQDIRAAHSGSRTF